MATKKAKKSVKKTTTTKKPAVNTKAVKAAPALKKVSVENKKNKFFKLANGHFIATLVAEFIGTFIFVAFYMSTQGDPRYAMFALIGIALLIGSISGAAINPAMTISGWITRKIKAAQAIGYLVAQTLGALAAWSVLSVYANGTAVTSSLGSSAAIFKATAVTSGKEWYVLFAEIIGAAILAFGLAAALKVRKNREPAINGALAYGFALYAAMFITYIILSPLGTGLVFFNPAIAFAASAVSFKLWPIAIYIVAPIIGGVLGFVVQDVLHSQIEISVKEEK